MLMVTRDISTNVTVFDFETVASATAAASKPTDDNLDSEQPDLPF